MGPIRVKHQFINMRLKKWCTWPVVAVTFVAFLLSVTRDYSVKDGCWTLFFLNTVTLLSSNKILISALLGSLWPSVTVRCKSQWLSSPGVQVGHWSPGHRSPMLWPCLEYIFRLSGHKHVLFTKQCKYLSKVTSFRFWFWFPNHHPSIEIKHFCPILPFKNLVLFCGDYKMCILLNLM